MKYGKTKEAVLNGHAVGMSLRETSDMTGIPENRLRYTAHRIGVRMRGIKAYAKYGSIKEAIHAAYDAGLTYAEASEKYGIPTLKLHNAAKTSGCYLKPSVHKR